MFLYKDLYEVYGYDKWKGVLLPTPFYANQFMPFNRADNLEFQDVALNHLLIQRDDVSIYSTPNSTIGIKREPGNIYAFTDSRRNDFTEFNGSMNGNAEGGDLSFGGEVIEAVVIRRSDSRSKFHIWEDIAIIPVTTTSLYTLDKIIYDPYVEHGITYQYAIQPVGSIGRGAQYETLRNTAVYDDIWMVGSDTKQLMMGYNPVVSGYKYIVKDTAIETIGGKYPYVVRNANVGYTQFQFSCTITAHMNIVEGKEVFTPFQDIDVLDEYKDIIIGEGGSGNLGTDSNEMPDRPHPTKPREVIFSPGVRPRSNERAEDSTNILYLESSGSIGPFEVMSKDNEYMANVVKFQLPISLIESAGLVDLRAEAAKNGTLAEYEKWVNGYEWTDNEGNKIVQPPHDWIPAFADRKFVQSITGEEEEDELNGEIINIRKTGFTLANEEVEQKIKEVKKRSLRMNKAFDPAYPSSPLAERSSIDSSFNAVNSDNQYMLEREFRRRVIEFLHDGKPKIFKSPTEGLILVKLTDISLTPNTVLGRMVYDFSCTCTEIGKVNSESLAKYGFREAVGDMPIVSLEPELESEIAPEEARQLYELFRNR